MGRIKAITIFLVNRVNRSIGLGSIGLGSIGLGSIGLWVNRSMGQ